MRIATLVDVIEAATFLTRLKPSTMHGCRSPFEVRPASRGAIGNGEHVDQALDALPALARAVAAFHTLKAPRGTARPMVKSDARTRQLAQEAERNARDVAEKLRLRWNRWLDMAQQALVVPDNTHLSSSDQRAAPWMTPPQLEVAREAGYSDAVDPFALAAEDRAQAEALLQAHRAHVAARIAATFRGEPIPVLRGLSTQQALDPWIRFAELADAIAATGQRRFGLAVSWGSAPEPSAGAPSRTHPPKCVFGALRICEPTDPACAMSFELPDRRTTERLRDHLARLRAFAPTSGGSWRPVGRDSSEPWRTLTLVHRLGRECRHVDWGSCALGWSTAAKIVWAGRPARDEGPDIAESLQRSGFRSIWFDADIIGAPD